MKPMMLEEIMYRMEVLKAALLAIEISERNYR